MGCILSTAVIGIMAAIIVPNFVKARSHGQLAACESNMKNIATGLEMYATDNDGNYPPSLDSLTENSGEYGAIMKNIPICPSCQKSYIYSAVNAGKSSTFTLECGGLNAHKDTGQVGQGNFPKYTPGNGLELK
jgi:type II secretory pathway pseudopilin PulG